ncbi:hypothetical protein TWF730_007130 [Orbilia blumenaviensis]|uniref:J domain-containing protein n=1 Tax=Orbilia blumenaviensis TaxID=1796055 RepID=A0AAV9VMK0_9PEZI
MPNYYRILGVSRSATTSEIRAAWKKQALKEHPDKNNGTAEAKETFQKLQEAYECLIDPRRRERYDRKGKPTDTTAARRGPSRGSAPYTATDDLSPETVEFLKKWRDHDLSKASMQAKRRVMGILVVNIARHQETLAQLEERAKKWDAERRARAKKAWKEQKANNRQGEKDLALVKEIKGLRAKIAELQKELGVIEGLIADWDDQETLRNKEKEELKKSGRWGPAKKKGQKTREQANKASEPGRSGEARAKGRRGRRRRGRQGEADQKAPLQLKGREAEEEKSQAGNREAGEGGIPSPAHLGFWKKVLISWEQCAHCRKTLRSFAFKCPGCQVRACRKCRQKLRGR